MQTKYSSVAWGRRSKLLNPQQKRHHHPLGSCSRIHIGEYIMRVLTKKHKPSCVVEFVPFPRAGVQDFKVLSGCFSAAWTLWMLTLYQPDPLSCCPSGIQRETRPCWLPWTEGEPTTLYQHTLSVSHCNYSLKDGIKNTVKNCQFWKKRKSSGSYSCCHKFSHTYRVKVALLVLLENKAERDTMWVFKPSVMF